MDYKISVVIRTYNEEKHIGEVLKSLNKQTYSNFEVIILDSQSTDNTIKIAQNYDVRIKISINPLPILALDAFTKWNAGKKTKVRLE